jgi:bacillithiol biosynthesis deacetylase BshB1
MIDILAVGAHPDDVELGAGGTLLQQRSIGHSIAIADLTAGELGTRGSAELRAEEASKSASILGIAQRVNLGLKDGFLGNDEAALLKMVAVIRQFQPQLVLANAVKDRHPDHGSGASFVSKACFLAGLRKIETSFEGKTQKVWRPKAVYHYIQDRFINPDIIVDISPWFEKKMEAIMAYSSQFYSPDSSEPETPISSENYLKFLEARAREMGRVIGATYGEGFTAERPLGTKNLLELL